MNPLEEQITEILHQLEDSLEFQVTAMFLSRSETHEEEAPASPSLLLLELDSKQITPKVEAMKKIENEYAQELENPVFEEEDLAANAIPSKIIDVKMVGLSETFTEVKDHLIRVIRPDDFGFFSFFGLPGTGRSLVAKRVYDDIYFVGKERSFDCGAWVRIGSAYTLKQILVSIISEIDSGGHQLLDSEGEDELSEYLYSSLEGKRYIIALDDIRDTEILVQLRRSLPEQNNGSVVFVTTSLMEVAEFDGKFFMFEFPKYWDEYFWFFIWQVYFGVDVSVSPDLVEAGKKIAKNCGGLPLVLARVILILQKIKKTPEDWSALAAAVNDRVYVIDDEISEVREVINYLSQGDYETWAKILLEFPILVERVKEYLYPDRIFPKMGISTICGMAGVGIL